MPCLLCGATMKPALYLYIKATGMLIVDRQYNTKYNFPPPDTKFLFVDANPNNRDLLESTKAKFLEETIMRLLTKVNSVEVIPVGWTECVECRDTRKHLVDSAQVNINPMSVVRWPTSKMQCSNCNNVGWVEEVSEEYLYRYFNIQTNKARLEAMSLEELTREVNLREQSKYFGIDLTNEIMRRLSDTMTALAVKPATKSNELAPEFIHAEIIKKKKLGLF